MGFGQKGAIGQCHHHGHYRIRRAEHSNRTPCSTFKRQAMNLCAEYVFPKVLKEFERVGGTETIKVDVRVIAATYRDLEKAMENLRLYVDRSKLCLDLLR